MVTYLRHSLSLGDQHDPKSMSGPSVPRISVSLPIRPHSLTQRDQIWHSNPCWEKDAFLLSNMPHGFRGGAPCSAPSFCGTPTSYDRVIWDKAAKFGKVTKPGELNFRGSAMPPDTRGGRKGRKNFFCNPLRIFIPLELGECWSTMCLW